MPERLPSGDERLDQVLGGGLLEHSITLLSGAPGTGKSLLAQQYVFSNATAEAPALYVSTVAEPLDKTVRYAQSLRFFDVGAVGSTVWYEDGGAVLREGGLPELAAWLGRLLTDRRPGLLVIDSFKALAPFAGGDEAYRTFLYDLAAVLTTAATTSLWLGEYVSRTETAAAPEAAVADAIVHLSTAGVIQRELRLFQVLKLRGSGFASGQHTYRLDDEGVHVFPRLAVVQRSERPRDNHRRIPTGLPELDQMLEGGYPRGSSTLVAGPTGSGKTVLGLHFLAAGAAVGEPGVVATLQDAPDYVRHRLTDLDDRLPSGAVAVFYRSPVDVYVDEWVYELLDTLDRQGARRVLVDGLIDLQIATADPVRFREYLSSLVDRFAVAGITALMTHELPPLFRIEALYTDTGYSNLTDSVVLLQYLMGSIRLQRAITVLKTQGAANDLQIRRFSIRRTGIDIGDPLGPRGEVQ